MLKRRIITVLWALPLLIAAIWFNQPVPWLTILLAVWAAAAAYEFYMITGVSKARFLFAFGIVWTVLFVIGPHFNHTLFLPLLLASGLVVSLIGLLFCEEKVFSGWAWTVAGALYTGYLLGYFVALRALPDGRFWVLLSLLTIFACDTAAFFVGRARGRHRLAPRISPGKTWEGAAAGAVTAMAASLVLSILFRLPIGYGMAVLLGFLISVLGQFGDLVESLLKRSFGVKDSGRLMPGHGGVLDRTDSVVFAGVLVYYYLVWVVL